MIRQASAAEVEYYEKVLYPFQDQIFPLIRNDAFYLSGGTCLSRFYYQHRFSDDLDFFFDGQQSSREAFEVASRDVVNRIADRFRLEMTVNGEYFKRFMAYQDGQALKVEFIYENYKNIGVRQKVGPVVIDTKENLATHNLTAVYDRKTVKDYVDLYYLLREIPFEQAVEWAQQKIVPLDYEGLVLTFADRRLEGEVLLRKELSEGDFSEFVNDLIRRMLDYGRHSG